MIDLATYHAFLSSKQIRARECGLSEIPPLADHLYPFQRHCVEFALRVGRAGLFLDTGLGKTECQLEFCQKALEASNGFALILTPLAVAAQTRRRAERWKYPAAHIARSRYDVKPGINICNYDSLHKLDPSVFDVVAFDEASILKSFTGVTTRSLIQSFRDTRFKMVATATPAPNDHTEIAGYSEFLDVLSPLEMLARFFINDTSKASQEWRLKAHAVNEFWDWMSSWSRMATLPSDMGDVDDGFVLPPYHVIRHFAKDDAALDHEFADLFGSVTLSATNMFDIKRQTMHERARVACSIIRADIEKWRSGLRRLENKKIASTPCAEPATQKEASTETSRETLTPKVKPHLSSGQTSNSGIHSGLVGRITLPCFTDKMPYARSADLPNQEEMASSTLTTATELAASEDCCAITATSDSDHSKTTQKICGERLTISMDTRMPAWVLWCDTNEEQNILENELGDLCFSIKGSQSIEQKEALHDAWLAGARPVLVTKPSICGFGCDWAHCNNMIFIGRTFSYETWYQAVRRCWRYGQKKQVEVHLSLAQGEADIGRIIDRKAGDHVSMKAAMREAMIRAMGRSSNRRMAYDPQHLVELPQWLSGV